MEAFLTELGSIATSIVGYIGLAAISALAIFAIFFGIRMVMRIFKGASK